MKKPDPALQELARRVMKARLSGSPASGTAVAEAMQGSCGELYRVLETAMGIGGLQALIDRAIQITSRDYPWMADVDAGTADCAMSGLTEAAAHLDARTALQGSAALLANILALLISFIGEDLTLRFVRHAWPKVSFSKLSEGSKE
jgi:hypothetical protein